MGESTPIWWPGVVCLHPPGVRAQPGTLCRRELRAHGNLSARGGNAKQENCTKTGQTCPAWASRERVEGFPAPPGLICADGLRGRVCSPQARQHSSPHVPEGAAAGALETRCPGAGLPIPDGSWLPWEVQVCTTDPCRAKEIPVSNAFVKEEDSVRVQTHSSQHLPLSTPLLQSPTRQEPGAGIQAKHDPDIGVKCVTGG